jgi:RHS repeat-associated protein
MWVGCPFSFDPWGQRRSVDNYNTTFGFVSSLDLSLSYYNKGFTGHEQFDDSGLVHMNGRIYDPRLGRFLSVDPMVQQEYNLQNLNRHSYVLNNPLNATDPSGYFWAELFSAVAEYFASDSFAQSISMAGISYASNGGVQFTYSSADAFSYGQGRSGLLSHNFLIVMILGGGVVGWRRLRRRRI